MKAGVSGSFGAQLKALREAAGFTQEELATIAGLSVHAVSALERGERRRPHVDTVRALSAALDLTAAARDALLLSARIPAQHAAVDELSRVALPLAPTVLLGRGADLQTLRQWLADPAARLITLIGPGGVGKSRLALELAQSIAADETATRAVFVALAAIRNPALVAPAIAEALGLSDVTALNFVGRARAACGDRPMLLVLDNFEQVLSAAPLVADLLTAIAPLRVLTTSRAPLRLRGEREYAVGPLALAADAAASSPADLVRSPAVRLFVERVRDVQPDFRLTAANGAAITAICRRLDALPLALELAAPWLKALTVEDLLRRLGRDVLLPAAGARDLPERQRTMNAAVAWSYQLLGPDEQRAFRRLGVLPGRFPIEAAAAVLAGADEAPDGSDDALGAVASLIDKSLLQRADTSQSARSLYRMLETVRACAALELAAAGELDDAMEGLTRHCIRAASVAAEGLAGPAQIEWLDRVHDDLENHRGAMTWLIERGRATEACAIAWPLVFFWLIRGRAAEGVRWYEQILKLPALSPDVECRALVGAALMWYMRRELALARTALTRAQSLAGGDLEMVAPVETMFGHVEHAAGNMEEADERFSHGLAGFQALAIPWGIGSATSGSAGVALAIGDAARAERLFDEATASFRHAGPWFLTPLLCFRATLAVQRGNPDEAIALLYESLGYIRELHDTFSFVHALVPLAAAAALKDDDVWAARILGARDAVSERTGAMVVDRSVHNLRERLEREVRGRLGPDRWALAHAAGRTTSIDALMKDIDSVL